MNAILTHLCPADYAVSRWSGGSTTQLAIAPEGAVYADRDFLWRLSSATVELEESDFTPLPDYKRLISTLKGEIELVHDGGAPLRLTPYQIHAFDGGAATCSRGVCTDFNLMLRKGACEGNLHAIELNAGQAEFSACEAARKARSATLLVYCGEGALTVEAGDECLNLTAGESALVRDAVDVRLILRADGRARCMAAEMWN